MNSTDNTKSHKPELLTALCLLTFAGSGAGFFTYFMAALFFEKASAFIVEYSSTHTTAAISPFYFVLFMALSAVSLAGAIRMWKLHRDGFFFYTLAQLGMIILPVYWLGWNAFTVPGAVFTVVFVTGYAINWMKMK
jgi:hypothetical protein